jgi:sugar phosphate isomerase/epimerase
MGARNILIPLTCPKEVEVENAQTRWIQGMKNAAPAAEKAGVVFCLENVGQAFANKPEDIAAVVDQIGSPAVQVYYDPGNAVHTGLDPLAGIAILGERIKHAHVKEVGGTYLGEGTVPWPQILKAFRKVGYDGWLIFETASTDDPKDAARRNLEAMRGYLRS